MFGEDEAHALLEAAWRSEKRLSERATIRRCEATWERLIGLVESGEYDDCGDDWFNDLDSRAIIQRGIDALPAPFSEMLAARVAPLDERYRAATVASKPYWQKTWWCERVPKRMGSELASDLRDYLLSEGG
jgi:hypothetical protein